MPLLGAHQSISGGYYRAVEIAHACGCQCVQLFTKNNNQWRGKPITHDDATRFRDKLAELRITHPIAHDSYLINLAAPDDALWQKSIDAFTEELLRAQLLGIPYVVMHPGSFTTTSEAVGLARVIAALDKIHAAAPDLSTITLLETTAGQGTNLGHRFEHLAEILAGVRQPDRLGVCVDTCHIFAAGYPLANPVDYAETFTQFDRLIGLSRIKAFHLNDSKKGLGSRVDRHEHIGQGEIGLAGFRNLLTDPRFAHIPMYLETPKGMGSKEGLELDRGNLGVLRELANSVNHAGVKSARTGVLQKGASTADILPTDILPTVEQSAPGARSRTRRSPGKIR
ncbi:MAG: deoxyribonuclease IV [Pirellulales bacterium]|nr:deoxyribonuclease IV [Pirellulales bacterium]